MLNNSKYQEALDILFSKAFPNFKDGDYRKWKFFMLLQELVDKHEKYRWHNSKDQNYLLPSCGSRVLVKYINGGYDLVMFYDSYLEKAFNEFIEGWKYIEEFEDE